MSAGVLAGKVALVTGGCGPLSRETLIIVTRIHVYI